MILILPRNENSLISFSYKSPDNAPIMVVKTQCFFKNLFDFDAEMFLLHST